MKKFVLIFGLLFSFAAFASPNIQVGDSIILYSKAFDILNEPPVHLLDNGQIAKIVDIQSDGKAKLLVHSISYIAGGSTGYDGDFGSDSFTIVDLNKYHYEKLLDPSEFISAEIKQGDSIECFGRNAIVTLGFTSKIAAVSYENSPRWTHLVHIELYGCSKK